jgi:hypothetical protein
MAIRKINGLEAAGKKLLLNKMNSTAQAVRLGLALESQVGCARGLYDFAVNGGAVSTINLLDEEGNAIVLPNKAIITSVFIDVVTAMTSAGGSGTISLGANTTTDLRAAVDADTLSGISAGVPVGTAATAVKLTAERNLTVSIATEALTAGKFMAIVYWVLGGS